LQSALALAPAGNLFNLLSSLIAGNQSSVDVGDAPSAFAITLETFTMSNMIA
jgi:hypothetical protein